MTDRPSEQLRALAGGLRSASTVPSSVVGAFLLAATNADAIASAVADLEGERDRLRREQAEDFDALQSAECARLRAAVERVRARCDGWIEVAEGRCQGWPEPCNCSACDFKEAFIAIRALGEGGDD